MKLVFLNEQINLVVGHLILSNPPKNQVGFLSWFKKSNIKLKGKPYTSPKIHESLSKLEGFKYSISLYLYMGYYHISLSEYVGNLCMIISPWANTSKMNSYGGEWLHVNFPGKYEQNVPGVWILYVYIDNILIIVTVGWDDHLEELGLALNKLK